jgi:SAM-dependent methyltransferase
MESANCEICQVDEASDFRLVGEWRLVRCRRCDLVYLNPRPDAQELGNLYSERYFEARELQHEHAREAVEREISGRIPSVLRLLEKIDLPCTWLDIGSASGYLLAAAQRCGCNVQGVEISEWASAFARDSLGLPVFTGTLQEYASAGEKPGFNLISMMSYLEHSQSPLADLDIAAQLLMPGGIVVIRVPNLGSFDRFWHGKHWWGWHLPYHLYHFTPGTLSKILIKAGLTPYRIEKGFWNPLVHLREARLGDGIRADHPLEARSHHSASEPGGHSRQRLTVIRHIKSALSILLTGRDMIVYARKED